MDLQLTGLTTRYPVPLSSPEDGVLLTPLLEQPLLRAGSHLTQCPGTPSLATVGLKKRVKPNIPKNSIMP